MNIFKSQFSYSLQFSISIVIYLQSLISILIFFFVFWERMVYDCLWVWWAVMLGGLLAEAFALQSAIIVCVCVWQ